MPSLIRSVVVLAAADGLVLHPQAPWNSKSVHIAYGSESNYAITTRDHSGDDDDDDESSGGLQTHGIVGLLHVPPHAFLVAITSRKQVAQFWSKPAFSVQDVAVIPLSNNADAKSAITSATQSAHTSYFSDDGEDVDDAVGLDDDWLSQAFHGSEPAIQPRSRRGSSKEAGVAEEVINRRGAYGRLAGGWFSRLGWTDGQRRNLGMAPKPDIAGTALTSPASQPKFLDSHVAALPLASGGTLSSAAQQRIKSLLPKLVRTTKLLFGSGNFFFSYEHDITRRLPQSIPSPSVAPLHRRVDPEYFFNHNLQIPFIEAGLDDFVLPLMQGFVGQRKLHVKRSSGSGTSTNTNRQAEPSLDSHDLEAKSARRSLDQPDADSLLLTLVSRRSLRRPGLRYLRRGVDEKGNVANEVETEQILSTGDWNSSVPISSFVQLRGSIPLYFTQSSFALKPVPVLQGSSKSNAQAFERHFRRLSDSYGNLRAVSLVNAHGNEQPIGQAYQRAATELNTKEPSVKVDFEWFDFHDRCKNMKFENVSLLIDSSSPFIDANGWTVVIGSTPAATQKGIVRSNCMDCLDRTNVVQAAIAEYVLNLQLASVTSQSPDIRADTALASVVSSIWADNGDAISKAYASSNALKGDFVRTRQRNFYGLLTDFSLTMTRYYHNLFEDFFVQATIDFMLDKVDETVFADFEAGVQSVDPSIDIDRHRKKAIDDTALQVANGGHVLGGWVLAAPSADAKDAVAPSASNLATVMNEVVFLLTEDSVIRARYDWESETSLDVIVIDLKRIVKLQRGVWIQSLAHADETRNVGFIVSYQSGDQEGDLPNSKGVKSVAFKALPSRPTVVRSDQADPRKLSEQDLVQHICQEVVKAAEGFQETRVDLHEAPLVDLAQARRNAGYLNQIGNSLRELILG